MPHVTTSDGVRLFYEEAGTGPAVVFVHEYAADYRTWEPQMRHFARSHRCVTYSQRGYPPSDVPENPDLYLQDRFRDDVIAVMDALKIDKAHVVGHSMGAATALHVGIKYPQRCISVTAAGCGYGSSPDPKKVEESRAVSRENGKMFRAHSMEEGARKYCDGPTRQSQKNKDPRGYSHFVKMMSEHSNIGHALVMENLQARRPTLYDMEAQLKKFIPPLLVIVGDEDEWCVDASIYLRRTVPTAGLVIVPRTGHTITSEEPDKFNAALEELFAEAERGRWLSHKSK
ncbi:MAG: alpha/beta hydrolase [Pseudolabrys sp.]|nr:alpha/beta hydrolase [Pseudolabrys sp.]MBV9955094.1 alpha/beta hydrolase [Pseudolabrys sp.]